MGEPARKSHFDDLSLPVPTFDELWKLIEMLPEGITGEIPEPGFLWLKRRPRSRHRIAAKSLFLQLASVDAAVNGQGWWLECEPDLRLGDQLVVPDLVGFDQGKHDESPDGSPILERPEFCCEILSPTTAKFDRAKKLPLYARMGIEWVWLIDPEIQTVEVYQSVCGRAMLLETAVDAEVKQLMPFETQLDCSRFWYFPKEASHQTSTDVLSL